MNSEAPKESRDASIHLDLLKHGDVAVLNLRGRQLLFICGTPRAIRDEETGEVQISEDIATLSNRDWHMEMIRMALRTGFAVRLPTTPQVNLDNALPYIRGNFSVKAEWERRR